VEQVPPQPLGSPQALPAHSGWQSMQVWLDPQDWLVARQSTQD
jgi:hypothetical protein